MKETKDVGLTLGQEKPLEEDMETHSSILAWRIPWTEECGGLLSKGLQRVGHDWSDLAHIHLMILKKLYYDILEVHDVFLRGL